jgi:YbbR domain-containing protein
MAVKRNIKGSTKRRIKIFLIFLLCSFAIWLISKLSENHTDKATFDLVYINVPDTLLLTGASKDKIDVTIRASGWQFLGFNFKTKEIPIDLSALQFNGTNYFAAQEVYGSQVMAQVSGSMALLQMDRDTLFFDFDPIISKVVPVTSQLQVDLAQNYLLDGSLEVDPDSVMIRGPSQEIDTVMAIKTIALTLTDVAENFSRVVRLMKSDSLKNTVYVNDEVTVTGRIFRFSEQVIQIPVEVVNLPPGTKIRTFPATVRVLCKAKVTELKTLNPNDFRIVADFNEAKEDSKILRLELVQQPENIPNIQLLDAQIEFILNRE